MLPPSPFTKPFVSPPGVSPMKACPPRSVPGSNETSKLTLRAITGNSFSVLPLMTPPTSARSVFSTAAALVTVMVSSAPPTVSTASTRTRESTLSATPVRSKRLKRSKSTETVYSPGIRFGTA